MFMVLVLHADYAALGVPAAADLSVSPAETAARVLLEQLSLVAVNVFVLISGWFGVRLTVRSLGSLLFQVMFYALLIIGVVAATLGIPAEQCPTAWLTLVPGYHHWFIRSYIGLMLLSPVLNTFTASCTVRRLAVVTGSFFAFQTVYGWICNADGFLNGYSLLSFIGLYLLGHLAHRLQWHTRRRRAMVWIYPGCVVANTVVTLLMLACRGSVPAWVNSYNSPLVIAGALGLVLTFAGMKPWTSRTVNAAAASSLAVYLIHFNPLLFAHYLAACRSLYRNLPPGADLAAILLFAAAVFCVCLAVDRLRVWIVAPRGIEPRSKV
ncbi:MAG TPA: hypothetical protein DC009_00085 [Porphyromonadaceae bacterium]|nr:hypothetical protein [Porphyromonadaceae bacterium]